MRLLQFHDGELALTRDLTHDIPPYAILSHTWGADGEEVTLQDISKKSEERKTKPGYDKILFCGRQAKRDGLDYFWVDTCCIDKTSSAELTEAINSMFKWYKNAKVCYAYLTDVSAASSQTSQDLRLWDGQFRCSRWFTRGWTLQELLAPQTVKFYSTEGNLLGDKTSLENVIHAVTNIKIPALRGISLDQFPVLDRMHWSSNRNTTKEEDTAYCLLGLFGVHIAPIYGEGKTNAMNRLFKAIEEQTGVPNLPAQYQQPESTSNLLVKGRAHFLIPFGQNSEFIGRRPILEELVVRILPKTQKNDCQRTVLEGLGGVGKTQIALEAAYRVREQDSECSIFWVPAITIATFENAYRDIGQALGAPGIEDDKADVRMLVKKALEKCSTDWLLIIDNIDDIGILDGEGLRECMPFNRKGSVLFTTRNHEVAVELDASLKSIYAIGKMNEAEALSLLQSGLEARQVRDGQNTKELLSHLEYLPLAIKQASAYMAKRSATTSTYLQYYLESDEKQIKLLNTGFEDRGRYSRDTNPIATTWLISFQYLERSYPLAAEYLKFICFLDEKNIPVSLLPPGKDKEAEDEAVGILRGYAFISIRGQENPYQENAFDIHRLVRLATRNWVKHEWDVCYTKAIQRLAEVYPAPQHENRQTWKAYMPHAQVALINHQRSRDKKATADLFFVMAESFYRLGKYSDAEEKQRRTLEIRKSMLGTHHPDTLVSLDNLGVMLKRQGKFKEAEETHRQTFGLRKSVLGAEHPRTLVSLDNLGDVLQRQGKYDNAEEIFRQTLELQKSVLGIKHPSTLSTMDNLGVIFDHQGRYEKANEILRQTIELKESVLSGEHPSTLDSINNLGLVLGRQGKYEEAEHMFRRTVELKKSVLGIKHPSTLVSMSNLGIILDNQGKYGEAEKIHRETLELKRSVLGTEHPSALISMNHLAVVCRSQGNYEEAEEIHRETLELKRSVLGTEHPSTLISMNNLALVLDSQGRYEEAEEIHRKTLELRKSVLGAEHPETLDSLNNLTLVLRIQGKNEEVVSSLQDTPTVDITAPESFHQSTLLAGRNIQRFPTTKASDASEEAVDDSGDEGGVAI